MNCKNWKKVKAKIKLAKKKNMSLEDYLQHMKRKKPKIRGWYWKRMSSKANERNLNLLEYM